VSVCDTAATNGQLPFCGESLLLNGQTALLAQIAPTNSVTLDITTDQITLPSSTYCPDPTNSQTCIFANWWTAVAAQLGANYAAGSAASDIANNQYTVYFGAVRPGIPGNNYITGQPDGIPSNAAAGLTSYSYGTDQLVQGIVAHESGHTLGLKHTNTANPPTNAPPGCYGFAADPTTDWPFQNPAAKVQNGTLVGDTGSNLIQGGTGVEVGFDVALRAALSPAYTFDVMGYCWPQWIAPEQYILELQTLTPPNGSSSAVKPAVKSRPASDRAEAAPRAVATEPFWIVTGAIPSAGQVEFGPLFTSTLQGETGGGSGTYSLVVENSSGTALFTQHFTPQTPPSETPGSSTAGTPVFAQLVPVTAGAAAIVLESPSQAILGSIQLGGVAPTVTVTNPTAVYAGTGAITWTISDPDSSSFTSELFYSANNGTTWSQIGQVPNSGTSLTVDFTLLPGTNDMGLIKVLVSDGINTGQGVSPNFSIPKKGLAMVQITSPTPNFGQPASSPVYFTGLSYDTEDGVLSGAALAWKSNLQGELGTGSPLSVSLQPGVHTITLSATDSANNTLSATTTVTIGGQPPTVSAAFTTLNAPAAASGCVEATLSAAPGANGAPLASVQYSLNGGSSYTMVPVTQLPFTLLVPGSGSVNLVLRATDASGQTAAQSASTNLALACISLSVPNVVGQTQAAASAAMTGAGLAVGLVSKVANDSIPTGSVIKQSPSAGTSVLAGSSVAVNLVVSSGPSSTAACDVNSDGSPDISDVQTMINEALGIANAVNDLNNDGKVNSVDVQIVIKAVLNLGCIL
jgi:hypothetical protein